MRMGTILLAAIFAVAMTTAADAAKKKKAVPAKPDPAVAAQQNTANLVSDAFQPWKPTRSAAKKK